MAVSGQFEVGHAKMGGRQVGTPNKATAEVKILARKYGPEAVEKLAKLMRGKDRHTSILAKKLAEKLGESGISKEDRALMHKLLDSRHGKEVFDSDIREL